MKEKTVAAVKPSCITKNGKLFQQKKEWFIETKGSHDREDQDS
jgi:hypothetical protein